jgi:hypothetical protein
MRPAWPLSPLPLLLLSLWAGAAAAQMTISAKLLDLVDARVDYQADYRLVAGNDIYRGTVAHAPRRERWEFSNGGGPQVLLLRRDIDEASMLWPLKRFYMSASFKALSALLGGIDSDLVQAREAGLETINGEATTRYHVDHGAFIGDFWRTRDGIMVKAVGQVTYNGRPTQGELDLTHVRRNRSDPALFSRPEGYLGIPLSLGK